MTSNNLILLMFILFLGCKGPDSTTQSENPKSSQLIVEGIPIGYKDFKLTSKLTKGYRKDANHDEFAESSCSSWTIKDSFMLNILSGMEQVEGEYMARRCYSLPCWYLGKIENGESTYEISIYPTSKIVLSNEEEELYFILEEESDHFIMACNCCE